MRALSLFSNCGAGDVGYAETGFVFELMAEMDERRLKIALRNHTKAKGIAGDLRVTWSEVVSCFATDKRDRLSLLSACPPCQGMSSARGKRGKESDADAGLKDERNLLVLPIANVATALQPRVIVVENVPAFFRRQVRDPRTDTPVSAASLLISLLEASYHVFPLLVDLCDYGVPQTRKRAFLTFVRRDEEFLAMLLGSGRVPYPKPTHAPDYGGKPISVGEALCALALPELDARSEELAADPTRSLHFVPVWSGARYQMIAMIPPNSGSSAWQNSICVVCGSVKPRRNAVHCPKCHRVLPRPVVWRHGRNRLIRGFHNSTYRRMPAEAPAKTITTASGRIGGNYTIHPRQNRVLSPLECAFLQCFPLTFDWGEALAENGHTRLRAMIGEAVPPLFTQRHGEVLRALLRGEAGMDLLASSDRRCKTAEGALVAARPNQEGPCVRCPPTYQAVSVGDPS